MQRTFHFISFRHEPAMLMYLCRLLFFIIFFRTEYDVMHFFRVVFFRCGFFSLSPIFIFFFLNFIIFFGFWCMPILDAMCVWSNIIYGYELHEKCINMWPQKYKKKIMCRSSLSFIICLLLWIAINRNVLQTKKKHRLTHKNNNNNHRMIMRQALTR